MALVQGDRLGPYKIESLLGSGGMGEVYRGQDARLGRAVALKVISRRLVGDEASRRRFETEARAASALNHPAIVTIYDIGETDGMSWIAMELIEGRTLSEVVSSGPLPIGMSWSIARQLADGLAVAHAKGIVHRDLKPANVMVSDAGRVKILDFGLARHQGAALVEGASTAATVTGPDAGATVEGTILGTIGYMAPEQATGRPADFRADQFSFGALIYELLTGRRAFARPSLVETLSAIIRDEPPPPASIRNEVSAAFERVITRCLAKEPAQRFESTRELATALEALTPEASAAGELPETADAVRPAPLLPATSRRLRSVAGVAILVAVSMAGAFLWRRAETPSDPSISSVAVIPFENPARDPEIDYISDGLTDSLIDHLSRAKSLKVMARATVMRFKGRSDPLEVARALGVGAVATGSVSRRDNQINISAELIHGVTGERLWSQKFNRPLTDLMRVQDSIVMSVAEGLRLRLSGEEKTRLGGFGTNNPEAYELFLKARFLMQSDTEADDLAARQLFMQAIEKDERFLDAYIALSSTYVRSAGNGYEPPREAMARARAVLAKAAAIDPNNVNVRLSLAFERFQTNHDWAAAEREFRALMHQPEVLRSLQHHPIALFFVAIGRPDEAVALMERALAVDPGNVESRVMLGNFLQQAGRLDDALRVYDAVAAEVPDDPRPLLGAADVYKRRGDFARASAARVKAYNLEGDERAALAFARANTEGSYAKAEVAVTRLYLRRVEELARRRYVEPLDIARLHAQIGNREQALAGLERAVDDNSFGLTLLKVDQAWDSVRAEPRFAAVVRRIGIP